MRISEAGCGSYFQPSLLRTTPLAVIRSCNNCIYTIHGGHGGGRATPGAVAEAGQAGAATHAFSGPKDGV